MSALAQPLPREMVLVVDDDPEIVTFLATLLELEGIESQVATSAPVAAASPLPMAAPIPGEGRDSLGTGAGVSFGAGVVAGFCSSGVGFRSGGDGSVTWPWYPTSPA